MVAYEVLVAAEEEDGYVCEKIGEKIYCWCGISCAEVAGDGARTFCPGGLFLGCVYVEGTNYVVALQLVVRW